MSRPMVKNSDGREYHDVLNGKNSQLQKTREAQETTHREGCKIEISTHLMGRQGTSYLESAFMRCSKRWHFWKVPDRYSSKGRHLEGGSVATQQTSGIQAKFHVQLTKRGPGLDDRATLWLRVTLSSFGP